MSQKHAYFNFTAFLFSKTESIADSYLFVVVQPTPAFALSLEGLITSKA